MENFGERILGDSIYETIPLKLTSMQITLETCKIHREDVSKAGYMFALIAPFQLYLSIHIYIYNMSVCVR